MAATLGCREHFIDDVNAQDAGREALGFSAEEMTYGEFRLVGGFPGAQVGSRASSGRRRAPVQDVHCPGRLTLDGDHGYATEPGPRGPALGGLRQVMR